MAIIARQAKPPMVPPAIAPAFEPRLSTVAGCEELEVAWCCVVDMEEVA